MFITNMYLTTKFKNILSDPLEQFAITTGVKGTIYDSAPYLSLFLLFLLYSCLYLYKKVETWVSPYNLAQYSKKQLLIPFLFFYSVIVASTLILLYICFHYIIINLNFPLIALLIIFIITIINILFSITLYIKIIKSEYIAKYARNTRAYFSVGFATFFERCKILPNGVVLNSITNEDITEEYMQKKSFYDKKSDTGPGFFFLVKKRNFLLTIFTKWLHFYIFFLNTFLMILTLIYFYYFNINFILATYTIPSIYIYGILLLITIIRFYQSYFILFKIKNNLNENIVAVSTFYKEKQKYFYFNISQQHTYIYAFIKWVLPLIFFLIFLLINCSVIYLIYNKLYFKKTTFLFTSLYKVPFGPILDNFKLIDNRIQFFFYSALNNFVYLFLFIIVLLFIIRCIYFYFNILTYITTGPLTKSKLITANYNEFVFLSNTDETNLINNLKSDVQKFNVNYNNIFPLHEYYITWFRSFKTYIYENYELYYNKKNKIIFYKNLFFIIGGSVLAYILLFFSIVLVCIYINIYYDINSFQLAFAPIFIQKRFMHRWKKVGPQIFTTKRHSFITPSTFFKRNLSDGVKDKDNLDMSVITEKVKVNLSIPRDLTEKQQDAMLSALAIALREQDKKINTLESSSEKSKIGRWERLWYGQYGDPKKRSNHPWNINSAGKQSVKHSVQDAAIKAAANKGVNEGVDRLKETANSSSTSSQPSSSNKDSSTAEKTESLAKDDTSTPGPDSTAD